MRCPILGGGVYTPDNASTRYNPLHGQHDWPTIPWYQVVPIAGKFSDLLVTARGAPGIGKSLTLSLYKDGAATSLAATVAGGDNKAEDTTTQVAAADGDRVCVQNVPSGAPSSHAIKYIVLFTPDDPSKGIILGNTEFSVTGELNNGATEYASIACGGVRLNPTATIWPQPMPTSGKFTYARVTLSAAPDPGLADGYTFTLQKNGVDTAMVITILGDNTTGTYTGDISFSADDYFNWKISPSGTPAATPYASWGLVYQPDTSGEAIVLGQTYDQTHQTNTEMNVMTHWAICPWVTFSDAAEDYENPLWEMTIKKLHILLEDAPGAGKSYTFTLYKRTWDIVGGDTALSVPIADAATSGGDDVNEVSASDYDHLRMKIAPSGTPAVSRAKWGIVMELPALVGGGRGSIKQQMAKKLLV